MFVNKVNYKKSFTAIDNTIFRDGNISLKAIGLLCLVMSLPPSWNFSREGLIACCKEGRNAINTALKELEEKGYLKRNRTRKHGKFNTDYKFYEIPFEQYLAISKKPKPKIRSRKSATGNSAQINTELINKNIKEYKNIYRVDETVINDIKTKIDYSALVETYDKYDIDKITSVIAEVLLSDKENQSTKMIFSSLNSSHIKYALDKAKSNSDRIKNYNAWMKKVLSNIPPKRVFQIRESYFTNDIESEDDW